MRNIFFRDEALSDRERKNLEILEAVRKNGPLSKTEVSQMTGINIVTVSHYVDKFIEQGLVIEVGLDVSSGGRRPALVELNAKAGYVIGIGMNLMNMVGVMADIEANIVVKVVKERQRWQPEKMVEGLADLISDVITKSGIDKKLIKGIGVGVSGIIDFRSGTVRWPETVDQYIPISIPIKDLLEQKFGIQTFIGNDATIAAFSEYKLAQEEKVKNMIYMFSGVGSGIIINGQLYCGSGGNAGELSIENYQNKELGCKDGQTCLLRRWPVDMGIADKAIAAIKQGESSKISDIVSGKLEDINIKTVLIAAKNGDKLAIRILEEAGNYLGIKAAFLANFLNPDMIIIGGGIEEAGVILIDAIKKTLRSWTFEEVYSEVKVIPSRLGENAVALGAISLIIQDIFISGSIEKRIA